MCICRSSQLQYSYSGSIPPEHVLEREFLIQRRAILSCDLELAHKNSILHYHPYALYLASTCVTFCENTRAYGLSPQRMYQISFVRNRCDQHKFTLTTVTKFESNCIKAPSFLWSKFQLHCEICLLKHFFFFPLESSRYCQPENFSKMFQDFLRILISV